MPKVDRREHDAIAALAARDEFEEGFRRSRRGNLTRQFGGQTLTVFRRSDGYFGWAVSGVNGVTFSLGGYDDEAAALGALWDRTLAGEAWRWW